MGSLRPIWTAHKTLFARRTSIPAGTWARPLPWVRCGRSGPRTKLWEGAANLRRNIPTDAHTDDFRSPHLKSVAIFPVAALGLVVVGFFVRVVMKISLGHRQRIVVDRDHANWTDERPEQELRDDQARPATARSHRLLTVPAITDPNRFQSAYCNTALSRRLKAEAEQGAEL